MVKVKPRKKIDSASYRSSEHPNEIPTQEIDYQLAYNQTYKKFKTPADLPSDLGNVILAYQQNDYNRVILESTDISATRGQNTVDKSVKAYAGLFKGIALMELNETRKAISVFLNAGEFASPGKLHDDLLWYTALCYLKEKDKDKCISILNVLKTNSSRKNDASLLFNKLMATGREGEK